MKNGKLIVIAAPSGSGKTTIVKNLISDKSLNLGFSVSATSREKEKMKLMEKIIIFYQKVNSKKKLI